MARPEALVRLAARNNAVWCEALCRTHGIAGRFTSDAWTAPRRTPPYYPDAVTLDPSATPGGVLDLIDTASAGASVKDSFACLDLTARGFQVVHDAKWIHRPAGEPGAHDDDRAWVRLRSADELRAWAIAWGGTGAPHGLFRAALLETPDAHVLATWTDGRVLAGAIVNRTDDVVGISNLFAEDGDLERAWRGCLVEAGRAFPDLAVVGYEAGDELETARRVGFEAIGPLRVWATRG